MAHILTIQSHVVYGHAGNAAAVFPMQRLGHNVSVLNLLQFSNHTGHGTWGGKAISVEELKDVFKGLKLVGALNKLDCILSGYIGSLEQAQAIYDFVREVQAINPHVIYCCDPVMGDERPGLYVKPEIAAFHHSHLVPLANWITPNRFELSRLVDQPIRTVQEAVAACKALFNENKHGILATSIANHPEMTGLLLVTKEGVHHCETPKYDLIRTVHGTGDVTTATFLSHIFNGDSPVVAMEKTANTMQAMTHYSFENQLTELGIVACQEMIAYPQAVYKTAELP
ncbi:MAG: pyridoxal kinase PdxY [Pseudomonadota bacterium]